MEKNQNNLLEAEIEFDSSDIYKFLNSKNISKKIKLSLIQNIEESLLSDTNLKTLICEILSETKYIPLDFNVLKEIISGKNTHHIKIKLINKHLDNLSDLELTNIIKIIGGDYSRVLKKQNKPSFKYSKENEILFQNLENRSLIKRFEIKDDKILK